MERRRFLGAVTAASLGVALDGAFRGSVGANGLAKIEESARGPANDSEFPENATVVLVHAAWADGSCWSNIVPPLEKHSLKVICAPIPLTSLTNDATALSWALDQTGGPVVLVGHAYSGAVIAAVRQDRVKSLVYIAALAPDEGETVARVFYRDEKSPEAPKMVPDSHGLVWLPQDAFHRALAQKASADQAKIAAAVQRPISVQCISRSGTRTALEIKTILVSGRGRRSHDQSEDRTVHGGAHACHGSLSSRGPHAYVRRSGHGGRDNFGSCAKDAFVTRRSRRERPRKPSNV